MPSASASSSAGAQATPMEVTGWRLPPRPRSGSAEADAVAEQPAVKKKAKAEAPASQRDALEAAGAGPPRRAQRQKKSTALADVGAGGEAGAAGGEMDYGMLHSHMEALTKLVVNNTQTVRSLCGSLHLTFLCPQGSDYVKAGKAAGEQYREQVRAEGKQHQRGPPHIHQFVATLEVLMVRHEVEEGDKVFFTQFLQGLGRVGVHEAAMVISFFMLRDAFYDEANPNAVRLTKVQVMPDPLMAIEVEGYAKGAHLAVTFRESFKRAIVATGGISKPGMAPRGQLERTVEGHLKKWQRARS